MGFTLEFNRLSLLVKRSWTLPSMPAMASQLMQAIDSGRATTTRMEEILCADPALAANLLRATNLDRDERTAGVTSLRWAIMKARPNNIRQLASHIFNDSLGKGGVESRIFDRLRFSRHSYFVANLATRIVSWRQANTAMKSQWNLDEIYVAALLHDFTVSLLARVAPNDFRLIEDHARHCECRYSEAFQELSGRDFSDLEREAAASWKLPSSVSDVAAFVTKPLEHETESSLMACISYCHSMSEQVGLALEDWIKPSPIPAEVEAAVKVDSDTLKSFLKAALRDVGKALPPERRTPRRSQRSGDANDAAA